MSAINVNKNNFDQEVLNSDKPVLMDLLWYTNIIEIGGINSWPGETVIGDK